MDEDSNFGRLGLLTVGLRRRMYDFIRQRRGPVTRDEAAAAAGISRKLAAFHLDKLADAGLLKAHYARPHGRGGPGAGRPSKLYEPGDVELEVSVPQRHYDIPGDILLEALETRKADQDPRLAAERVAYERGLGLGHDAATEEDRNLPIVAQQLLRSCGRAVHRQRWDRSAQQLPLPPPRATISRDRVRHQSGVDRGAA